MRKQTQNQLAGSNKGTLVVALVLLPPIFYPTLFREGDRGKEGERRGEGGGEGKRRGERREERKRGKEEGGEGGGGEGEGEREREEERASIGEGEVRGGKELERG